jgi:ABC-type arginine transport system ATPase subunit
MIDEDRNLKHLQRTDISSVLNCKDHGFMAQTMTCSLLLKPYKILEKGTANWRKAPQTHNLSRQSVLLQINNA